MRTDGVSVATRTTTDWTETMYTQCLFLVALIVSAFASSGRERGAAPTRGVTIVERLRSEFLSVLDTEAAVGEGVSLPARRSDRHLTTVSDAPAAYADSRDAEYSAPRETEKPAGLLGARSTFRRGSTCWWLWLLFGNELCPAAADRTTIASSPARGGVSQMSVMRADG